MILASLMLSASVGREQRGRRAGANRTAVELVCLGVLVGLLVGGVGGRVDEAAGLAVLARQEDVGGVDEEG